MGLRHSKACNYSCQKSRNSYGIIYRFIKLSLNAMTNFSMADTPLRRPLLPGPLLPVRGVRLYKKTQS